MMSKRHIFERWAALLFGIAVIWMITSVIVPMANTHIPGIDRLISVIETHDIDPGAFWYMDIEGNQKTVFFISSSAAPAFSEQEYRKKQQKL